MRLPISLLCLTLSIIPNSRAIFADDAYEIDYHHQLLGIPQTHATFFHRPRPLDKPTLLYTLSDLGVIGAVNPATGEIVWRQLLAYDKVDRPGFFRPVEGEGSVVSAIDSRVDAWDASNGKANWGNTFAGTAKDLEVMEKAAGAKGLKDILVLFEEAGKSTLRKLEGATGNVAWEFKDESSDVPLQVSTDVKSVYLVALHGAWGGYNVKVTVLDPATGKKTTEYTLSTKSDVHSAEDVLLVGANSAAPIVAWTDKTLKTMKVHILGKSGEQSLPLKEVNGGISNVTIHAPHLIQSLPHFLVHSQSPTSNRADVYHIDLTTGSITLAYELPQLVGQGAISTSSQDANVYFTRFTEDEIIILSSISHGILGKWKVTLEDDHGALIQGIAEVVKKASDSYAARSAIVTNSGDWVLVRNGAEAWSRPEGLSGVVAAEWAEIPQFESLVKTLEEESHSNPLSAYIHRVTRHIDDLRYLPGWLEALPVRVLNSILPIEVGTQNTRVVTRDTFGFNKLVIVATQRGQVIALNAGNKGSLVWSMAAQAMSSGQKWSVQGIFVNNKQGQVEIYGTLGDRTILNATTGEIVGKHEEADFKPISAAVAVEDESGTWIMPFDLQGKSIYDVPSNLAPSDTIAVRGPDGDVRGIKFEIKGTTTEQILQWSFLPRSGQKITNVVARPAHDPVASIGKVLWDRNVLYKYLNPNAILVTAIDDVASSASFYLLDSVSGDVLYIATHEGIDTNQPIPSALTENWFAYSIFADSLSTTAALPGSKGYQLVVSELFESEFPNDRGPFGAAENTSSINPSDIINAEPAIPHVVTQSFMIPEAISKMSVTQTGQGITTRQLLCVLPGVNGIFAIPRTLLDPRRPVGRDQTALEAEEGLFRYKPFIEVDPKYVLTHKREVIGVKDIITSPALLESTSLLFAFGIDIFGSRVSPSAAFDILGKGFNKLSLVATVVALWLGVIVLTPMARRKQINLQWMS
ncbi:hypothetical protein BJ878DRAFT_215502 [Calycina marina]|uniref:ER membrane protein complex subunit 1 n=1 Tax=Calycina marina TaxID=1763456 RepID=A0A9P7YXW7_9HELO|nr:hypothetical protein BJ878DRAFT_215502 [Calycina marina]